MASISKHKPMQMLLRDTHLRAEGLVGTLGDQNSFANLTEFTTMPANEQWEQLLTPAVMQEKLISASLYITAFELLRESIIGRIRDFFNIENIGLEPGTYQLSEEYRTKVLARNKSTLYASLDWLIEHDAIDLGDLETFERIKSIRNKLAHELPSIVMGTETFDHVEIFQDLITILRKIGIWWVVNVEIPANPDFDGREIDETEIVPGPVLMLQMMLEVLSGNEDLLEHYRKIEAASGSDTTMPFDRT
ncbi:hypothetical protein [Burkholderia perseverans]|uniref:hypothetical protein n=1 Tax=Burkholderia perseverans TaxID=2615214 RepID=UPI001FEE6D6F|nr:hypothetical protein [Burkholderia perseverans]